MKIPYRVFPDKYGSHIYSVTLHVSLALPRPNAPRTKRFEAIIDSGATRCVFHSDIGRFLGLKIEAGEREATQGITGLTDTFLHDITLFIPGGPVTAKAAFKDHLPVAGLLGMNGFFEHFVVTFGQSALVCEIDRIHRA